MVSMRINSQHKFTTLMMGVAEVCLQNKTSRKNFGKDFWPQHLMPSFEEFVWCWQTLQTRGCYFEAPFKLHHPLTHSSSKIPTKSSADNCCLIPFIDFANHSPHVDCTALFNKESNCYEIRSHTAFKKGDQVFISYGKHGNSTLLLFYGFVFSPNPFDSISLDISTIVKNFRGEIREESSKTKNIKGKGKQKEIKKETKPKSKEDELMIRKRILNSFGLDFEGTFFGKNSDNVEGVEFSWNLFVVLRVLFSTQDDINKKTHMNAFDEEIVSDECEMNVLSSLIGLCDDMIKRYPTSLEDDDILLSRRDFSYIEKAIIILRRDEKTNGKSFCLKYNGINKSHDDSHCRSTNIVGYFSAFTLVDNRSYRSWGNVG